MKFGGNDELAQQWGDQARKILIPPLPGATGI